MMSDGGVLVTSRIIPDKDDKRTAGIDPAKANERFEYYRANVI